MSGTIVALDVLPGLALAAVSMALGSAWIEGYVDSFPEFVVMLGAGTGIVAGVGSAAVNVLVDACADRWRQLSPTAIVVPSTEAGLGAPRACRVPSDRQFDLRRQRGYLDSSFGFAMMDVLLPGEWSPFDVPFSDAPAFRQYDHAVQWETSARRPNRGVVVVYHRRQTQAHRPRPLGRPEGGQSP